MKQSIDVFSTAIAFQEDEVQGKTVVVIDVLRACSSIVTALNNGAKSVIPVGDMGAAGQIAMNLDPTSFVMCGERDGEKIEGYQLGNSPFEYKEEVIGKKTLILNTTNGTRAISKCSQAKKVIIGCFLNLNAVIEDLKSTDGEIILICAGWKNRISLEDTLCAGAIIQGLYGDNLGLQSTDGAKVAFGLFGKYGDQIPEVVQTSNHATRLKGLNSSDDIAYCTQINKINKVPYFTEGIIS
ncbi:MAG: 2-phosphosulfolactate phosphatase [Balneolales bacterium]